MKLKCIKNSNLCYCMYFLKLMHGVEIQSCATDPIRLLLDDEISYLMCADGHSCIKEMHRLYREAPDEIINQENKKNVG